MRPDKPKTTFTSLNRETKTPPRIIFGVTALRWICAMVEAHTFEVGFYGMVDARENYTFFVRDIFYPKHSEANGATCEISPEGETRYMEWLCSHGREDDTENVRLWGHSHHNMGTGASTQDENQAIERMNRTQSFLIRAICNKKGEMSISFFDYANRIRFDHIKWEQEDDSDGSFEEDKVTEMINILSDNDKSAHQKIAESKEIVLNDNRTDQILSKVKELKAINIPSSKRPNALGGGDKSQLNLLERERYPSDETNFHPSGNFQEEMEEQLQRNLDKEDNFDKKVVDEMVGKWESEVGIGK